MKHERNSSADLPRLPGDTGQREAVRDVLHGRRGAEREDLPLLRWLGRQDPGENRPFQ